MRGSKRSGGLANVNLKGKRVHSQRGKTLPKRVRRPKTRSENHTDIHAVAREAGVSIATVSRVMNGFQTVDPKLSKLVRAAVKHLNYIPNTQARALLSGKSRLFGVIISDITNPFFPELLHGFEEKAVEVGYETLIGSTMHDPAQMETCIQRMLQRKVDGVAVMTFGIEWPLLSRFAEAGIPLVFVDKAPKGAKSSVIPIDYQRGIGQAIEHLAELGHRDIAFISGPRSLYSARAREAAFRDALKGAGLQLHRGYVREGDHTAEGGMAAMEGLLGLARRPTAIVCSNDMTAIGVMHAAYREGLRIPEQLSVIGFDDINLARYTLPPLTSIVMSRRDLASAAVLSLKAHQDSEEAPRETETIETNLIVRQTTSPPARSRRADIHIYAQADSKVMMSRRG